MLEDVSQLIFTSLSSERELFELAADNRTNAIPGAQRNVRDQGELSNRSVERVVVIISSEVLLF